MFLAIELWKESGLSQYNYCMQNNLSINTFKYWYKKYPKGQVPQRSKQLRPFIPVHIPQVLNTASPGMEAECISIRYPNGLQISCPVSLSIEQLRTLIML